MEYKIDKVWNDISNVHHITVNFKGLSYSVIFGEYINGGFYAIPNWNTGGELAEFSDVTWNTSSIYKSLSDKEAARAIAKAIRDYSKQAEERG